MVLTVILVTLLLSLLWFFFRQRKAQMMVFKNMGIPGPEPNIIFGNLLAFRKTPLYLKHQEWRQEYGETYGYFEGPTPVLVTSDVNLLQKVFIKHFNKFHARKLWPVQVDPDNDEDVHLFFARGRRWKRLKNIVTPAFSASKMKSMAPTVNDCINHLMDVIKDKTKVMNDRSVELFELFRRLTIDTILRCEMGIEQNSVKNPDDLFLRHCKAIIDDTAKNPWLYTLGFIFPSLHCVWIAIYKFLHKIKFNPVFWVEDRLREIVEMRRNIITEDRVDLMQQMLKAEFNVEHFRDIEGNEGKGEAAPKLPKSMTNEEIVSHALLFVLAGYETTSTTLAYIFYELSQNPQVQHQLRQEVMTILPRGYHSIEYDDLGKLKYLDYVIWEVLRKYPLASTVTARQCMQECKIGNIVIPAGMLIHANLWDVQYDPRHWGDNPHEFDPLRFIPSKRKERHPMSWMPFGGGPRACAGIRFAFLQLKMVVAKVLRDFDFQPSHRLSVPLNLKQGATIMPADGLHLSAMRRGSAMSDCGNARRNSVLATLGLDEWNASRRSSVQEQEVEDNESSFVLEENSYMKRLRRRSSPLITSQNRLPQINIEEFDDNLHSESDVVSEDSIITGFEMLRRASLSKGLEFLLKSSNLDLSPDGEISRRSSMDTTCTKADNTSLFTTLIEDSVNRYKKISRRGSALPVLESVGEYKEMTSFMTSPIGHSEKVTWQRSKQSNRLAHRRGSG